jgi:DNA-binding NarL/FixJ family response regulator
MPDIKVLIIEDEPLIAEDIAFSLKKNNFIVSNILYSVENYNTLIQSAIPDVVLLDINLQGSQEGIEIARFINNNLSIPVVFLTSYSDQHTIKEAKLTQPAGYIVKPFTEGGLCAAIEIAVYNHIQNSRRTHPDLQLHTINAQLISPLSEREFDVLKLLYEGYSNNVISEKLFISRNTVKAHLITAYLKLDVNSRAEAIAKLRKDS